MSMQNKISQTQIVSYVAIALSIMAIIVSVFEVSLLRDEVKTQAWPYVQLNSLYSDKGYTISIENKGVGPAKIKTLKMYLDNERIEDLDLAIEQTLGEEKAFSYDLYRSNNPAPGVMSANENIDVFSVPWQPNTRMLSEQWASRFSVEVCYCSIFDECWEARLDSGEPEDMRNC